jgi:hypothetical protein
MHKGIFMRTTLDLPDDVLRQAKIAAVERGLTLRQVVIDALKHELGSVAQRRRRLTKPPVQLSADAPLRSLSPEDIKRLDAEAVAEAETRRAIHR